MFSIVFFIIAILAKISLSDFTFKSGGGGDFSYDDESPSGPAHWGKFSKNCDAKQQSPINLSQKRSLYLTLPPLIPKKFNAIPENIKLINNGYTVQYNFNYGKQDRPTLSGGPLNDIYVVDHIHLHWGDKNYVGSEHQLNGKPYPLELHIVTQNTKYDSVADAKKYSDGLAVLGILYLVDSRTNQLSDEPKFPGLLNILNKTMSSENNFLKFLPNVINAGSEYTITEIFTLNEILKGLPLFYYTYKGSLTTPTCDESVTWMVLREPLLVKKTDMEMLRALKDKSGGFLLKNYRPIQKIKHRYVLRNC